MAILYSDYNLQLPVEEKTIFEGIRYFLNVETYSPSAIDKWFEEEYIQTSIENYHPQNKILIIRFHNIVGFVNILGKVYDVRSNKLYDNLSGNEQFQSLLNDVSDIYGKLSFNFKGTAYAKRETQYEYNLDDLDVFDYYYQLAYLFPNNVNLDTLIAQCLKSPNTINTETSTEVRFDKSKKLSSSFYTSLGNIRNLAKISNSHSLAHSAFPEMTNSRIGKRLLPLSVTNTSFVQTTNTTENRFLKYFLEEINGLCIKLINQNVDSEIVDKAKKLQKKIGTHLLNPFFKNISRLTFVPSSSSVLLKKAGYKEIYYHFVQSKFAFTPILDNQKKYALKYGLKNIASLYELWVFLRIAYAMFGDNKVTEIFEGQVHKYGTNIGSYKWQTDHIELHYNKSYTRLNGGSYSVTLRPDISLTINKDKLYLFDAKYKFISNNLENDALVRIVKPEDIHKMHAYLDAIPLARIAIVVYPGTEIVFYKKHDVSGEVDEIFTSGVGAIPLSPNNQDDLLHILNLLKVYNGI